MRILLGFLVYIWYFNSFAIIKVAIIDTGLNPAYTKSVPLCADGHKDLTGEGFKDINGHGTNVTGLIVKDIKKLDYCIVIIKAFAFKDEQKSYIPEALEHASRINVNVINISGGGEGSIEREKNIITRLLDKGVTIVAAAGNNGTYLDLDCNYYPACYDKRIYIIGNYSPYSNYGKIVDDKIDGKNKTAFGVTLSGTSQSAAIFTNQLLKTIKEMKKSK